MIGHGDMWEEWFLTAGVLSLFICLGKAQERERERLKMQKREGNTDGW